MAMAWGVGRQGIDGFASEPEGHQRPNALLPQRPHDTPATRTCSFTLGVGGAFGGIAVLGH